MNIKDIRLRKGLTQADVAAALGVSSVVYSRYETGKRQPSIDMLIQMADIFGVTVDFLLGRQDIEDSTLSDYELQLLIASRKADERAKQDALNMLLAHAANTKTEDN
jgi:transcriptional regulator with XRE-family HTH domain